VTAVVVVLAAAVVVSLLVGLSPWWADRLRSSKPQPYPYQSEPGNVTVLGPETFIDADGLVICHKGENYYLPAVRGMRPVVGKEPAGEQP
jgi:hypothetical protein